MSPSGKRPLVFDKSKGLPGSELQVPCRNCLGCRVDRSQAWATRLMHEAKYHEKKCFLTLTYSDLYVPENGSLEKDVQQKFFKKLRARLEYDFLREIGDYAPRSKSEVLKIFRRNNPIRYFWCGEYGDLNGRPHYHAILYGVDFPDRRKHSKNSRGEQLWVSDTLEDLWGLGHCQIGDVTHESCAYVARYVMKKVTGDLAEEHYQRVTPNGEIYHIEPEFIRMSLKPAIGKVHYENFKTDFYPRDYAVVRGRQVPVPKYYDRLLEAENPQLLEEVKDARKLRAKSRKADNTPERRKARAICLKSKLSTLSRKL